MGITQFLSSRSNRWYSVTGSILLNSFSPRLQLEDAEFAAQSAQKGKKKLEEDVADLQGQLDTLSKTKKEVM